ncbi:MAG: tryptophan--tRNA ligase [Bacilli bacterium]|nr:tryptophan--tRNA ligase [Bacilli bacterium]
MKRVLTGLQPSGELTLGNYIGGIRQLIKYQDDYELFVFVPDLHSITVEQDPKLLKERIRKNIALYIASGLDPEKCTLYIQSENLYHANLSWILECHSYIGEMSRMTQFKEKSASKKNVSCGLFTYPILMAADILLYDADLVPTGADQKQHVELARNIAERFNSKYGETFNIPEPLIPEVGARIKDLQEPTKKMSKSSTNEKAIIRLLDDPEVVRKKIMSAVTDSDNSIYFDEEKKPGISNLLTIYSVLKDITIEEAVEQFKDSNYGTFKKAVADTVVDKLTKLQKKYNEIINLNIIDEILDKGYKKTNEIASKKYYEVKEKVGLGRTGNDRLYH